MPQIRGHESSDRRVHSLPAKLAQMTGEPDYAVGMKLVVGSVIMAALALSLFSETPANANEVTANATEETEPLSCSLAGHKCSKNFDCCSKMCWKGNCT